MFQQGNQEVKTHIQALEHANKRWQEYYSEKASKNHELIKLLKEYKTDSNNEVVKETIVRLMKRHLEDL